ncbi:MAG: hypothetical protein U0L83_01900 [Muribaculaceae bacterium]|nr:hypothetical protein [Muribaculaceae bacterium]
MGLLRRLASAVAAAGILLAGSLPAAALAEENDYDYERSSLAMMLIRHEATQFGVEIQYVFSRMRIPDRFNDHGLGVRLVSFAEQGRGTEGSIESFVRQVALGRRLVARWFNRDKTSGVMNMDLVRQRGLYNATRSSEEIARSQMRGMALLEDAGENLLNNTYVVFNDITYVDHANGLGIFKDVMNVTSTLAQTWLTQTVVGDDDNPFENPTLSSFNASIDDIKSFRVKIVSYLYRLRWNDEVAGKFYSSYYTDSPDAAKSKAFDADRESFTLEYVGKVQSTASNTSMKGTTTAEQLITKVCTRAVDKNLAKLQKEFADFRIKAPLVSTEPLVAHVGLREDVTPDSRFEVLERSIDKTGKVKYRRVGVIRPEKGRICDNRYWAKEEETENSRLQGTTFTKVSGGSFYPGMLIREIK